MAQQIDWDKIRKSKWADVVPPADWPQQLRPISINGTTLFAIDPGTNDLYWDGHKLVAEKRFAHFERMLAVATIAIASIGVLATVVQAWAAVMALPPTGP